MPGDSKAAEQLAQVEVLTFDIDGTLTDATTWWAGEASGWVQRYSVRDGEALLRLTRAGIRTIPLSRNGSAAARLRMQHLKCETRWLGVDDKLSALAEILELHGVAATSVLHIGDGLDDAEVFRRVGLGVAVGDAHPEALAAAGLVLAARGGDRAIEELEHRWMRARRGPR